MERNKASENDHLITYDIIRLRYTESFNKITKYVQQNLEKIKKILTQLI